MQLSTAKHSTADGGEYTMYTQAGRLITGTSQAHLMKSPSVSFMMLALCTAVTRLRPFLRA